MEPNANLISANFPQYPVVSDEDLVSNDLSLVAPPPEVAAQQENPLTLKPAKQDNPPPFKLTPRGHSAPVIISQVESPCLTWTPIVVVDRLSCFNMASYRPLTSSIGP